MRGLDLRTIPIDELRSLVHDTHVGITRAWVAQAWAFRRIREVEAWKRWGFRTWDDYLESDLPGLTERTVKRMTQALGYLDRRERALVERIVSGEEAGTRPVPGWYTVSLLARLQDYVAAPQATGGRPALGVPAEKLEELHQAAFELRMKDSQLRAAVGRLKKGLRFVTSRPPVDGTDTARVSALATHLAVDAAALAGLKRMVRAGETPVSAGQALEEALVDMLCAISSVFGEKGLALLVAKARQRASATVASEPERASAGALNK